MKKIVREFNLLCQKCFNKCKQAKGIELLGCPNYEKKPQQLQFNFSYRKKRDTFLTKLQNEHLNVKN